MPTEVPAQTDAEIDKIIDTAGDPPPDVTSDINQALDAQYGHKAPEAPNTSVGSNDSEVG